MLLSTTPAPAAVIEGIASAHAERLNFSILPSEFQGPRNRVWLLVDSADGQISPVVGPRGSRGLIQRAFGADRRVVRMTPGNYQLTVETPGAPGTSYQVGFSLLGDVNGDNQVNRADLRLMRGLLGQRVDRPGVPPAADINNNGIIDRGDLAWAARNLRASTSLSPLAVTMSDLPAVVSDQDLTVTGETRPGASVVLVNAARPGVSQDGLADASGAFQFETTLAPGQNALSVRAGGDGFGQVALAQAEVSLGDAEVTANDVRVLYTSSGSRTAVVTVSLPAPANQSVTVGYTTVNGSAHAGVDYRAASGTIVFAPGQTSQTIPIVVKPSRGTEPTTQFAVRLTAAQGGSPVGVAHITIDQTWGADGRPTLVPLRTLKQFLNWRTSEQVSQYPSARADVPLANRLPHTGPPMLVGFDLGELANDPYSTRWSQGGSGTSADGNRSAGNIYNFDYWRYVDMAYYFGHELVTLPPTAWTNAAHANGVQSLGTLNLSSNEPKPEQQAFTDAMVQDPATVSQNLIAIANHYGFDGYLLNYEYRPDDDDEYSEIKTAMLQVLSTLKDAGLKVVWYDSEFSADPGSENPYANELNQAALPFLNSAGYYQTNYFWGPGYPDRDDAPSPERSLETLVANYGPTVAQNLRNHVFTSKDAFKRPDNPDTQPYSGNFFEAFRKVVDPSDPSNYLTGLGIFGPNWTMTRDVNTINDRWPARVENQREDRAFWEGTGPNARSNPIDNVQTFVQPRSVIASSPFDTDFNVGEGSFYNVGGVPAATDSWNDLANESILPTEPLKNSGSSPGVAAEYTFDDAYNGGSSLALQGQLPASGSAQFLLYRTAIAAAQLTRVELTVKSESAAPLPSLFVTIELDDGTSLKVPLGAAVEQANGWVTLAADLGPGVVPTDWANRTVQGIGVALQDGTGQGTSIDLRLGELRLLDPSPGQQPSLQTFTPTANLNWSNTFNPKSSYRVYGYVGDTPYLLGVTRSEDYAPSGAILNRQLNGFTGYVVQEVTDRGDSTPLG